MKLGQKPIKKRENRELWASAMTIAGSDSGGGAGIQVDLKTFAAVGVHGTSVITCLTAQNPLEVRMVTPTSLKMVRAQLETVMAELPPQGIKTGMLYSSGIIREVVKGLESNPVGKVPLVVDPVMIATSGAELISKDAVAKMERYLFPIATLITPNLHEASHLLGRKIESRTHMELAVSELSNRFGLAVLLKGGHLEGGEGAADLFCQGDQRQWFTGPFIGGVRTHGTGCTLSAAIAANLAQGRGLLESIQLGKELISQAIRSALRVGGHDVIHPLAVSPPLV